MPTPAKPLRKEIKVRHGTTVLRTIVIVHAEPPLNGFRILDISVLEEQAIHAAIPDSLRKQAVFIPITPNARGAFASANPVLIQKAIDAIRVNATESLVKAREEVKKAKAEERAKIARLRKTIESFK